MKRLVDTNVLLDYLLKRVPYEEDARKIVLACKNKEIEGCIAAYSASNTFYILRKEYSEQERRIILTDICRIKNEERRQELVLHPDRNQSKELPAPHHCVVKISSRWNHIAVEILPSIATNQTAPYSNFCLDGVLEEPGRKIKRTAENTGNSGRQASESRPFPDAAEKQRRGYSRVGLCAGGKNICVSRKAG